MPDRAQPARSLPASTSSEFREYLPSQCCLVAAGGSVRFCAALEFVGWRAPALAAGFIAGRVGVVAGAVPAPGPFIFCAVVVPESDVSSSPPALGRYTAAMSN